MKLGYRIYIPTKKVLESKVYNMALNMENATVGVSSTGLTEVIEDIQANLIDAAVTKLDENVPTLKDNVSTYWVGDAAVAFQEKIESDTEKLKTAFSNIRNTIDNEIRQMGANVFNSDATIAESIRSQIN